MSESDSHRLANLSSDRARTAFTEADYANFCARTRLVTGRLTRPDIGELRLAVARSHADCVDAGVSVNSFTESQGVLDDYKRRYLSEFMAEQARKPVRLTLKDRNLIALGAAAVVAGTVGALISSAGVSQECLTAGIVTGVVGWRAARLVLSGLFPTPAEDTGMESFRIRSNLEYRFRHSAQELALYRHGCRLAKGLAWLRGGAQSLTSRKD